MLARRRTTILPARRLAEALETTRLPRVAGRTGARTALVTRRPCRAPPHTLADVGRIGGGQVPLPGDVSRAHQGIVLLDARPEFRRHVLDVLRQPLEEGSLSVLLRGRPEPLCCCGLGRTHDGCTGGQVDDKSRPHHRGGPHA